MTEGRDYFLGGQYLGSLESSVFADSEVDFAEYVVNECCNLEEKMGSLHYYFDYKAYARDLFRFDYDFSNGYVFRSY